MFEGLKNQKKIAENMKDDDELDMLLGEIPHVTSSLNTHHQQSGYGQDHASCVFQKMNGHGHGENHVLGVYNDELLKHYYACTSSPVSGFSLPSNGSSSSLFTGGVSPRYDIRPPPPPPQFQEIKNRKGFRPDFKTENVSRLLDGFNLGTNFSRMNISEERECIREFPNGVQSCNRSLNAAIQMNSDEHGGFDNYDEHGGFDNYWKGYLGFNVEEARSLLMEMQHDQRIANLLRSRYSPSRFDGVFSRTNFDNLALSPSPNLSPQFYGANVLANSGFPKGVVVADASCDDTFLCSSRNGMNVIDADVLRLTAHYSNADILQHQQLIANERDIVSFYTRDCSLIIQGETNQGTNRGNSHVKGPNMNGLFIHENGGVRPQEKSSQVEGCRTPMVGFNFPLSSECSSIAEARGYIYEMTKDQNGCRLLQRIFDEGTCQDVQIIFSEIIKNVAELMIDPFGNYLMQKLLDICDDQQRMHILLRMTEEPGELVRISLNTHGTRVVQKLIRTLQTRQQTSLVIAALKPGFLALIKDSNGSHVIHQCLQCFTSEDTKFIFVGATKHCMEIATHQHGCRVLQRCISHSTGVLRENLVSDISENAYLLAQDRHGNYVLQLVLDLKIPSSLSTIACQFEGNYVYLSTQKFSSHVVEKCLMVCKDEMRSTIIHELLSTSYFDQLLQDPHANYVVQTALRVSEGPVRDYLVHAIESYKVISQNSPYSKRIFSHKLLKR